MSMLFKRTMKKASLLLAVCMAVSLLPGTAIAALAADAGGEADGATGDVPDAKYFVTKDLGGIPRQAPKPQDSHEAFGIDAAYGYPRYTLYYDGVVEEIYKKNHPEASPAEVSAELTTVKQKVLEENNAFMDFDGLDSEGNYYKGGALKEKKDEKTITKLFCHTAGKDYYGPAIPDEAEARKKHISIILPNEGNVITGLYAPAGEIVTVKLLGTSDDANPEELGMKANVGLFSAFSGTASFKENAKFTRFPISYKTLALDKDVNYVGSPLGGPIYIQNTDFSKVGTTVELEISGAVEMPYYIQGQTSREELARLLNEAPGPYFDFATARGLRLMGPGRTFTEVVQKIDADTVIKAMKFWDKALSLSYQFESGFFNDGNYPNMAQNSIMLEAYIANGVACSYTTYSTVPVPRIKHRGGRLSDTGSCGQGEEYEPSDVYSERLCISDRICVYRY